MVACSEPECGRDSFCRGWCRTHYQRWYRTGTTTRQSITLEERFWSKVDRSAGPEACWLWIASRGPNGYGYFGYQERVHLAHRIAWQITNGREILPEEIIRHSCDKPPCVNPAHLLLGTNADNSRDMVERGRSCTGERHGHAKLTEQDVKGIRVLRQTGVTYASIAERYGVSRETARRTVIGTRWRHL
jgi:hypothetical protein